MNWQRRKGNFYVKHKDGMRTRNGIHYLLYPFIVHREERFNSDTEEYTEVRNRWMVTHLPTGFNLGRGHRLLKDTQAMVEKLTEYPAFLLPTQDAIMNSLREEGVYDKVASLVS